MDIFIRRLPPAVTRLDLINFIERGLKPRWSLIRSNRGRLVKCEIFVITDRQNHTTEYHALARVEPSTAAISLIGKLNGQPLKGKTMTVRKFMRRSALRDKRHKAVEVTLDSGSDQRRSDRRRSKIRIDKLAAGTTGSIRGQQSKTSVTG